jgi:cellulose synthase/poly-beta-1,6-N-acetylglucosamine synthase-like glycosyltransferase
MNFFFVVTATFTLVYFLVLDTIYLIFTLLASRDIAHHLRRRYYSPMEEAFASPLTPGVSLVIPALNESKCIVESVQSLLALHYPLYEIIVINDGSTDDTLSTLQAAFDLVPAHRALRDALDSAPIRTSYVSKTHESLWVLDKENAGCKGDACNMGINAALHPYVCILDADEVLEPDAVLRVAAPIFDEPELVVATSGVVRIANGCLLDGGHLNTVRLPRNPLAALQVIEYFRSFLVSRVGWSRLNALPIISGAFGVFQRNILLEIGGYSVTGVGEDIELVISLHRHMLERALAYRVSFVPDPVCWTEAPADLVSLARQRRRWHRGLGQTLWRHRRIIGNPRFGVFGLFTLPYFVVFEFLAPVVEIFGVIVTVLAFALAYVPLLFFLAFLTLAVLVNVMLTIAAITLEEFNFRRHHRSTDTIQMIFYSIVENIGYRQLSDLWRLLGMVDLARRKTGWGSTRRRGFAQITPASNPEPVADQLDDGAK